MQRVLALGALLTLPVFIGCIGADEVPENTDVGSAAVPDLPEWAIPIPATIAGIEHVAQPLVDGAQAVPSGAGIWVDGDYAYVSGLSSGFHVVKVSDPSNPVVVGSITDEMFSRDADVIHLMTPDGVHRLIVALATQSGGMTFVDATDPTTPWVASIVDINPNHNLAVVPGTCLVYNSPSNGRGNPNEIVDACDPENAAVVAEFGDFGCHDITFWSSPDGSKKRAYCAGVGESQIYDIADPLLPELVTRINNVCMDRPAVPSPVGIGAPCRGLHHSAFVNPEGNILILGDEFMGGGGPGCGVHADTPAGAHSTPLGALWFYDIGDETSPVLRGWFAPDVPTEATVGPAIGSIAGGDPTGAAFSTSCTSHFGAFVPGHDMVVWGWYLAGVLLIDFSDPAHPLLVSQWNEGTDTWDAKIHNGYIFTGDIFRGLDVLKFVAG